MSNIKKFEVQNGDGDTPKIASNPNREEIWIRNDGPGRVWLSFNEPTSGDAGIYLDDDESTIISSGGKRWNRATAQVYMTCLSGVSAVVYADITS